MKGFLSLTNRDEISIEAKAPFSFRYTVKKPSHFPTTLEFYDKNVDCFYRSMRLGKECIGLKMRPQRKENKDTGIVVQIFSVASIDESDMQKIKKRVSRSYGLAEEIAEFYSAVKDRKVKKIIKRLEGMRNSCFENLYEILNISIILQNTNVRRSQKMMANLLHNFGERIFFDGVMLDVFFSPQRMCEITETQLRDLGLGYRSKYILKLAEFFSKNRNFEEEIQNMPLSEVKKVLLKMKGIGPYSVNLVLFSYFRKSQFINFDVWNRKIISNFLFGKEVELVELEEECERRWGAFKGYIVLYIIEDHFIRNFMRNASSVRMRGR